MKYLLFGQESKRLLFRELQHSDFKDWLPFHEDPETSKYWVSNREKPDSACKKWFEKQFYRYENDLGGMNALIEKKSGLLIGFCGLLVQTVDELIELEIGYSLLPQFWNNGYATEAAKTCLDFAFENNFTDSLISIISTSNIPSQRVAIKIGMQREKSTIYDGNPVNIYSISKGNYML